MLVRPQRCMRRYHSVMEGIDMLVLRKKLRAFCLRRKYKRLHLHLLLQILRMKEFLPLLLERCKHFQLDSTRLEELVLEMVVAEEHYMLGSCLQIGCSSLVGAYCILVVLVLALLELELEQLELVELEHTEWMGSLVHNLVVLHIRLEYWLVVGTLVVVQRWWALVELQMGCCILVQAHHTREELAQVGCMLELQEQELVAFVVG